MKQKTIELGRIAINNDKPFVLMGGMNVLESRDVAMQVAADLYARGIWVPAIRPPTVTVGTARLRVTLSAAHTADDVAQLVDMLQQLEKEI